MFPPWMDKNDAYAGIKVGRWTYGRPQIADYGHAVASQTIDLNKWPEMGG